MGRKQSGAGKHFFLCVAGLILSISGCVTLREGMEREQARNSILLGQSLLAQGDYEGSLRENQKIASLFAGRPPGDEAIFNTALIYADDRNPNSDYQKAASLFYKVVTDFPQSPLSVQARIWIGVLEAIDRLAQSKDKLTQANDRLNQTNEKLAEANEKLTQANEKLTQANEKLNQIIKKSKEVDLEIELKKREKEKRAP